MRTSQILAWSLVTGDSVKTQPTMIAFPQSPITSHKLPPLKFRRAEHQPGDNSHVHLPARIIELRLQHLRVVELLLERLDGCRRSLPAKKNLHRAVQRRFR